MAERSADSDTTSSIVAPKDEFAFDDLLERESAVIVDFYADWCGPCQMMEPTIESVAETVDAAVVKVDVDAFPQIAARFDVSSIPTLIGFEEGEPSDRLVGAQQEDAVRQLVA